MKARLDLKKFWYKCTSFFRLKVEEHDLKQQMCAHPEYQSPQSMQGMWQAYGQMRAARTAARGAIVATSGAGVMLWLYQQSLSTQAKELSEGKKN